MNLIDFQVNSNEMLYNNMWYKTYFDRQRLYIGTQEVTVPGTLNSSTGFADTIQNSIPLNKCCGGIIHSE